MSDMMISSVRAECSGTSSTPMIIPYSVSSISNSSGVVVIEKARLEKLLLLEKNYIQIIAEGVKNAIVRRQRKQKNN
jgi:hypothetical protein